MSEKNIIVPDQEKYRREARTMGATALVQKSYDLDFPRLTEEDMAHWLERNGVNAYAACAATDNGRVPTTLTAFMDTMLEPREGCNLTSLERMMQYFGIATKNDIRRGVFASPVGMFFNVPAASNIFPEFLNQTLLEIAEDREEDIRDLVVDTIYTPTGDYRQPKIDVSSLDVEQGQVGERGEFPEVTLELTSQNATVGKRGAQITSSYEASTFYAQSIQILQATLREIALKNFNDLVALTYDAIINSGVATETKNSINSADANGSNTWAYRTHLLATGVRNGYIFSAGIANLRTAVAIMEMQRPSVDPIQLNAQYREALAGMSTLVNLKKSPWVPMTLRQHTRAANWTLPMIDPRYALFHIKRIGLDLVETEKVISRQINRIVISNADAMSVFNTAAIRIVTNI